MGRAIINLVALFLIFPEKFQKKFFPPPWSGYFWYPPTPLNRLENFVLKCDFFRFLTPTPEIDPIHSGSLLDFRWVVDGWDDRRLHPEHRRKYWKRCQKKRNGSKANSLRKPCVGIDDRRSIRRMAEDYSTADHSDRNKPHYTTHKPDSWQQPKRRWNTI